MKRILELESGITMGDVVRDILTVFPEIQNEFTQRKTYDEYYFNETEVDLTIEKIEKLNELNFIVKIGHESITLS